MIIESSAPCRISLFGGGTDVAPYANRYGGLCLNMAVNIRQKFIIETEGAYLWDVLGPMKFYDAFFEMCWNKPQRVKQFFDGEIAGGLGSSASAAVAMVGAIARINNIKYDLDEIARVAWNTEVNKLELFGGKQDQWAAAYGGINLFEIAEKVKTTRLDHGFMDKISSSLILFHTGKNRKNPRIQEGFIDLSKKQVRYLDDLKELVPEGVRAIKAGDVKQFAALLNVGWKYKKRSNGGVSTSEIDALFEKAKRKGSLGAKVLGAGGGGCVLFVVPPEKQHRFKEEIGLKWIDFSIDYQGLSCRCLD